MFPHGIFRITAASPAMAIANPASNVEASLRAIEATDADLVLLPELGLTGYTCGDLFGSQALLSAAVDALKSIAEHSRSHRSIVVVGLPLVVRDSLMNCAAVVSGGQVRGIVPKSFLPNYREFYEARYFRAASDADPCSVKVGGDSVPFGTDLLFCVGEATIG
ncbi:MAG: nitrilase-related carbon-nitrogen hydrolase, partial [Rubripirellula sp.]